MLPHHWSAHQQTESDDKPCADAVALQRRYYEQTAGAYDDMHVRRDDEHGVALRFIAGFLAQLGCRTVLDVGAGTGRAASLLAEIAPSLSVISAEPVMELLQSGIAAAQLERGRIVRANGAHLPFKSRSFDAVIETGVLHHMERPALAVAEMLRVSRRAVCLSDSNRFGQGSMLKRLLKLGLYRLGIWNLARRAQQRGRLYSVSTGDGVAYSYSVFDSLPAIAKAASRTVAVPTLGGPAACSAPILFASHVCLCAELQPARE